MMDMLQLYQNPGAIRKQSNSGWASAETDENLQANLTRLAACVMRNPVMRNDLTFHVLRVTLVVNSANIAAEVFLQV